MSLEGDFIIKTENNAVEIVKYLGNAEAVEIPAAFRKIPVTSIGEYVFLESKTLKSVKIPDSVTNIGEHALYACDELTQGNF